jgi:SulP family sulfate permease
VLLPKIVTALSDYDREKFLGDLVAGVIVGVVALPLAIAFAIASGVTPDRGLWTAIVAGFLISLLGGSRVQIGGPTGAFVVIVYGIVQKYGIDGLTVATLMAGVILVGMGVAKLGTIIKFIPHPVITGFTSGIALIISGEIKDFFGLHMGVVPADFVGKWSAYAQNATGFTLTAFGVSTLAIAIILLWPKLNRRIPGTFVALIVTTLAVQLMHLPVETIGTRFGGISASVPHPQVPHLSFAQVTSLVGPAFTIALLAAIESLLSAVVADGMIGGRHRSNMQLVAQGIANIASPLFGGIPATGAIARTATNIKNGARRGKRAATSRLIGVLLAPATFQIRHVLCSAGEDQMRLAERTSSYFHRASLISVPVLLGPLLACGSSQEVRWLLALRLFHLWKQSLSGSSGRERWRSSGSPARTVLFMSSIQPQ